MFVFVCSPYRGDVEKNVQFAIECCSYEMAMGNTPFAPHLIFPSFTDDDADAIQHGLEVLSRCDVIHVWGDKITEGMREEIEYAESVGIPVGYMGRR